MPRLKILYLGNKLAAHGVTPTSVETLGEKLKLDFEVIQGSSKKNKFIRLLNMLFLVWKWRKADYLIIDTYSTSAFIFAWTTGRLAKALNLKYIPILHGGNLPKRAKVSPQRLANFLKYAYKVVCPSKYLMLEMQLFIKANYELIPNFIDISKYPYLRRNTSIDTPIRLFWLRSFHKIYNPELAIQVLDQLHDIGYDVTLCMVGPDKDGSKSKVINLASKLGVSALLKIPGRLNKSDWVNLSEHYNIFINTTSVDNTPVSVLEAMALGFPIVTTNVGGIPYLFEDMKEGMMVAPQSADEFVRAIEWLLANSEKSIEMGLMARKAAELWDWKTIGHKWRAILK